MKAIEKQSQLIRNRQKAIAKEKAQFRKEFGHHVDPLSLFEERKSNQSVEESKENFDERFISEKEWRNSLETIKSQLY